MAAASVVGLTADAAELAADGDAVVAAVVLKGVVAGLDAAVAVDTDGLKPRTLERDTALIDPISDFKASSLLCAISSKFFGMKSIAPASKALNVAVAPS